MKYLVTGGAGFIGSHLVEALIERGHDVRVLDNFSTGKRGNVPENAEVVEGDIRDRLTVRQAMQGIDAVCHLAALVSVQESVDHPELCFSINANGSQIVLDEARQSQVGRVVLASSAAVYGNNLNVPLHEKEDVHPLSPYGLDKLYSEQLGHMYHFLYGMPVTALRFFNVYGPRQDPASVYSGVISIFIRQLLSGNGVTIFGDGEQTRDFVYVKDVVCAILLSLTSGDCHFSVYNVGSGTQTSINDLYAAVSDISGREGEPFHVAERMGDIYRSGADISSICSSLGYSPKYSFDQGLRETIEWFQQTV